MYTGQNQLPLERLRRKPLDTSMFMVDPPQLSFPENHQSLTNFGAFGNNSIGGFPEGRSRSGYGKIKENFWSSDFMTGSDAFKNASMADKMNGYLTAAETTADFVMGAVQEGQQIKDIKAQDATIEHNDRTFLATSGLQGQIDQTDRQNWGKGMELKGTMTGASIGTAIFPGIGTLIGAGAGLIGGLIGKRALRDKAEKKQTQLKLKKEEALEEFNADLSSSSQRDLGTRLEMARNKKRALNPIMGYQSFGF